MHVCKNSDHHRTVHRKGVFNFSGLIISIVVFLLLSGGQPHFVYADTVQTRFDSANQKLKEGYYEQALELYQTIVRTDSVSGPLFLNMGITYTRLDSLGKAKYYLLKARNYPTTRKHAQEGLNFVNDKFSNQSAVLPKLPWDRAIDWLSAHWGAAGVFGIALILLMLAVSGTIYTWFFTRLRRILRLASRILAGLGIIVVLLSLYMNYVDYRYERAVMTTKETIVKQKPRPDGTTISKAYEGYTFTVDLTKSRSSDQWYYVRLPNGMNGWIQRKEIKLL